MKSNMKKILSVFLAILMLASLNVTVFAADLTNDITFYYTVTKDNEYTDFSGVKLAWSVPVVKYTNKHVLEWDNKNLQWTERYAPSTTGNSASFTLANYGSKAVTASVSFAEITEGTASVDFGETNNPTLQSIVNTDHTLKLAQGTMTDEEYLAAKKAYIANTDNGCAATISGTVTLTPDNLTADSGKLGTYTVTISYPTN